MKGVNWRVRTGVFAATVGALMSLTVGCGSQSQPPAGGGSSSQPNQAATAAPDQATPKKGGTITVAFETEPDTLDVHRSTGASVVDEITGFMGGSLVYVDGESGEVKPSLAESYTISQDGLTWTFKIRSGITFHDGTKLTAKSFKDTFERLVNPQTGSKSTQFLMDPVKSIEAPDDQTLIFVLKEPNAPFLLNLADPGWLQPLSMEAIKKAGNDYGRNPVGVGPWKFESWKTGESISLTRNDAFNWGEDFLENKGAPRPDKLVIKFITDKQTRVAALESGSIDVALNVAGKDIDRFRNNPKFTVIEKLRMGSGLHLSMNMKNENLQDINVRKAINMAVNKQAIVQAVLKGEGEVAHSILSPTIIGYDKASEEYDYKYDVEGAKKLLDDAGWKVNGSGVREKNGKQLAFTMLIEEKNAKDAQLLQGMLKEIGIKVEINTMEAAAALQAATDGKFDLLTSAYTYNDPDIMYLFFHSSQIGGFNFGSITDAKYDELVVKGRTTIDVEQRKKIYAEAQKLLTDQAYIVPIYIDKQFTVVNSRVQGVKMPYLTLVFNDSWVNE